MASTSALVDSVLHPEIPFFDDEHLIVGGVASAVMAFLCGVVVRYSRRLEQARDELEARVEERTAELLRSNEQLREEVLRRRESERALVAAKDVAEKANMVKGQFLTNMSHELRTPFNGIMGMIALVLASKLTTQQRQYLDMAQSSAERLLRLINNVLDFSKIDAGALHSKPSHFSLQDCLAENFRVLTVTAREKGLDFSWQVDPEIPERLFGDEGFLSQVLVNLVGNAIKFTDQGSVRVGVTRQQSNRGHADTVQLHFTVADTGKGVPVERQRDIFEPFTQIDGSLTRRHEGTGLGLAICADLVKMLDGEIWVESRSGEGAIFHFTACFLDQSGKEVAFQVGAASVGPAGNRPTGRVVHVLVAEDDAVNRMLVEELVRQQGFAVTSVENGRQALDAVERLDIDLVLMDIQMPEMDGIEATAQIRRKEQESGGHLPIVALTAHAMKGDEERFLAAGMDAYVAKPLNPKILEAVISRQLEQPMA
ncbi:MAG: response regulator [Desulfobulbaceae bacterium]|nr:response regulator [Desulfobulbaceae bacterium]HIJ90986.1 response regulator [Deltaproteobacteria bacterium]